MLKIGYFNACMEISTIKVRKEEIILLCRMLDVRSLLLWKSITGLLDSGWLCCSSVPLCCSCAKTDGVIKRWSALSALVKRPHRTAQASNGRFVTAETAVHSQGSTCGSCGEQSGIGTGFGSPLSQHSTTKPNSYVIRNQFGS